MKKSVSLLSAMALLALCSCQEAKHAETLRTVAITQPEITGISNIDKRMSLPGIIKEGQTVRVSFKTGGQINHLNVKEGDYVSRGQTIATLDDSDYRLGLNASQAQYDQVKNEVSRVRTLYEHNSISKNEYEKAISGLEQLEADLQSKKNQLNYTRLTSPAQGYVTRVDAHVGELVNGGMPVVTLMDVSRMEVEVGLPSALYQHRKNFNDFSATINGKEYPLTNPDFIPQAGSGQQYTMILTLPSDREIRESSGLNVEVNFTISDSDSQQFEQKITIPESAIVYDGSEAKVWVLNPDSTVTARTIKLGTIIDSKVSVTYGLTGSESIVRSGASMLHEGEKVKSLKPKSSTNPGGLM